jgi:hypothetical protein
MGHSPQVIRQIPCFYTVNWRKREIVGWYFSQLKIHANQCVAPDSEGG